MVSGIWLKNKKKKKKKKLQTRQACIRLLDKYFSLFIRHSKSDKKWIISCVSCKKKLHWKEAHNCHYIDRAKRRYRRDVRNCYPWCVSCNMYRQQYHMRHYTVFMINEYWQDVVDSMLSDDHKIQKVSTPEIRDLLVRYKAYCKENELI
jgi:hypothetical protein